MFLISLQTCLCAKNLPDHLETLCMCTI